jgi:CubicO group peptidase (beta-lactamase class C family)
VLVAGHTFDLRRRMSSRQSADPELPCPSFPLSGPISDLNSTGIPAALSQLDSFLSNVQSSQSLAGLMAIVVLDQQVLWFGGYGSRNFTDPTAGPPVPTSSVRVASISKVFTTLMMYLLRDSGVVSLDDALSQYMADFRVLSPYRSRRPITLRQLASHTSGLPRENPCGLNCTEAQVLSDVARQWTVWASYEQPHYSNLGFALLGRALAHAVGPDVQFEDWMAAHVLAPLRMNQSSFYTDDPQVVQNMAVGRDNGQPVRGPLSPHALSLCLLFASRPRARARNGAD